MFHNYRGRRLLNRRFVPCKWQKIREWPFLLDVRVSETADILVALFFVVFDGQTRNRIIKERIEARADVLCIAAADYSNNIGTR